MRTFHTLTAASLGVLCALAALHGCGGTKVCNPACSNGAVCQDGRCVATCDPTTCGYDGVCYDGGCARGHPGRACAPPTVVAGGLVGPAAPPPACVKSVRPSALPPAQVQDLGVHRVGERVSFNVPANTASFTIVSQVVSAWDTITFEGQTVDNSVVPDFLRDPDAGLWYDDNVFPSDFDTALFQYGGGTPVIDSFTVPATTESLSRSRAEGVSPGTWSFLTNDYAYECTYLAGCDGGTDSGTYDLKVLTKPGPATSNGTLDLSIYLVETSGLDSGSALTDPHVQRFVQSATTLFAQGDICLGNITFYDVPAWATTRYATSISGDSTGPCDLMPQMFTLSQTDTTLNLFWVSSIGGGSSGTILGIDGTIPGPSTVGGTIASGAAMSIDDLTTGTCNNSISPTACGADQAAYIAAHESGHWLGLFHTSEGTGTYWDSLVDTPKCICTSCVNQTTGCGSTVRVTSNICNNQRPNCGGADNLMFWLLGGAAGGHVSPLQGEVMRRNLAVH